MSATNAFFIWFFTGLNGLGGWFIFLLLALAAVIWLLYDSSKRHLPALGWRLGTILLAVLILPAMIYRFSPIETQLSLDPFIETIFYLGLLGGILPPVLAIGYFVTFKELVGCQFGHVYEAILGECPECSAKVQAQPNPYPQPYPIPQPRPVSPVDVPPPVIRPKTNAWLVSREGRNYQLCQGVSTIGRSTKNDIQFSGELTISREHAKIIEKDGRFYITDLASQTGTKVNNRLVRQMTLLEPDDEIQFGDTFVVHFVTTHR